MSETNNPETNQTLITQLEATKKHLETEIRILSKNINDGINIGNNQGKDLLNGLLGKVNETIETLKGSLDDSLVNSQKQTLEQLYGLKESLDGQLSSLRGYANQLVEDEEFRLVSALETSLTSIGDINKDHSNKLSEVIKKIGKLSETTSSSPIVVVEKNNLELKENLADILKMEKNMLVKALEDLQGEFREEISDQIERVFMGVTITKETLNGIIQDTLSRLEENLQRLNKGIDENFTNEIGLAQDLIHNYEGKLLETLETTKSNYDQEMVNIIDKNSKNLVKGLAKLTKELNQKQTKLEDDISGLNTEQQELLKISMKELDEHIVISKAQIIDSHGILKDELEKLLDENTESINEVIESMKLNNQSNFKNMQSTIKTDVSQLLTETDSIVKGGRKEIESLLDQIKNDSVQTIDQLGKDLGKEIGDLHREEKLK